MTRGLPKGRIYHTDLGSQYCPQDYQKILRQHGLKATMGGKGNCYDCEYDIVDWWSDPTLDCMLMLLNPLVQSPRAHAQI
jgi:hypothetical protein